MRKLWTTRQGRRKRRHVRVRARVEGTAQRPRLSVHRSLSGVYVQLIDDQNSKTIAAVSSKNMKGDAGDRTGKVAAAYVSGKEIAEKAKAAGVSTVVFDRGGFSYHGRVKAVADGARDGGLNF